MKNHHEPRFYKARYQVGEKVDICLNGANPIVKAKIIGITFENEYEVFYDLKLFLGDRETVIRHIEHRLIYD